VPDTTTAPRSLTGRKIFSTGAEGLRWMVVWARVGETQEASGFLVRSDSPGISIEPTWDHLGLRASRGDDVLFAGTPAVPTVASGGGPLFLAWNSLGLTSLYLGVADAARDWLVSFLTERSPASLGRPLATLPRFQAAVGEIDASLETAGALLDAIAARVDNRDAAAIAQAPMVKLAGTRAAIDAVSQAVALVGNNGLTKRNPLERHLRDVLCSRVHTPQDDSIVATAGRAAFPGL
jgi:alkylation response protein AidB-like acyl-CoA dehydrogenase